jgi:hypothetical protein
MSENTQPEPDIPTRVRRIAKNYVAILDNSLEELARSTRPRTKRTLPKASVPEEPVQEVAVEEPKDLGISGWLKGPRSRKKQETE